MRQSALIFWLLFASCIGSTVLWCLLWEWGNRPDLLWFLANVGRVSGLGALIAGMIWLFRDPNESNTLYLRCMHCGRKHAYGQCPFDRDEEGSCPSCHAADSDPFYDR